MKEQLLLLVFIFSFATLNGQLNVNVSPTNDQAECEGLDPNSNAQFQSWLNTSGYADVEVDPSCSPADLVITNDYDPSSSWSGNLCSNQATVEFCFSDCTSQICFTVAFTIEDSTPPVWTNGTCPSSSIFVSCGSDIPILSSLNATDLCEGSFAIEGVENDMRICDNFGTIIREWHALDQCGNTYPLIDCIQTIQVGNPLGTSLQWINPNEILPPDIGYIISQELCDSGTYSFPDCLWGDAAIPTQQWPDPTTFMEGVHFQSSNPCGDLSFTFSAVPCSVVPGTSFIVEYELLDNCGNELLHSFEVNLPCGNCTSGIGSSCSSCAEASLPENEGICNSCNVNELLNGFSSCTLPSDGSVQGPPQPNPLCNGAGVPNNMSWFAFVAGGTDIEVNIKVPKETCLAGDAGIIGLQAGIYDFCDGECLAGSTPCGLAEENIVFSTSELKIGSTYFIFIDGCAGSECAYEIFITGQDGFELDDMEAIIVESNCGSPFVEENTFCSGQMIKFNTLHDGTSMPDWGVYDPPGSTYAPDVDLTFVYSFSPPLDGHSLESWNQIDLGPDCTTPEIQMPLVTSPTHFTICIEEIIHDCDTAICSSNDCCIDITVQNVPNESYLLDICIEDLLAPDGWDPTAAVQEDSSSMFGWLGPTNIMLDPNNVQIGSTDTLSFNVQSSGCQCSFVQELIINPIENCTSSNDNSSHNYLNIQLYPNPVKNLLKINTSEDFDFIRISNKLGQVVKHINWNNGEDEMSVDFSNLKGGLYFISFMKSNKTYTKKIMALE